MMPPSSPMKGDFHYHVVTPLRQRRRRGIWQTIHTFLSRLVLEVFGGAGAIWGFSEALGLRTDETVWYWRPAALAVGFLFFVRWCFQLYDEVLASPSQGYQRRRPGIPQKQSSCQKQLTFELDDDSSEEEQSLMVHTPTGNVSTIRTPLKGGGDIESGLPSPPVVAAYGSTTTTMMEGDNGLGFMTMTPRTPTTMADETVGELSYMASWTPSKSERSATVVTVVQEEPFPHLPGL